MSPPSTSNLPIWASFACSAAAACTGEATTLPLDTAKVRLQLQAKGAGVPKYKGLIGTIRTVAKEEGASALWKGLEPESCPLHSPADEREGLHRQCLFGGLRIGLYEPVKKVYMGDRPPTDAPLYLKVAAGLTTGAVAIAIASPTDLVKVRMQSEGKRAAGQPKKYPNAFSAYGIIAREEGLKGLWRGIGPNVARNAIVNAAELASYDQIKESLIATGLFEDTLPCHLASGSGAGFFAVCIGSPVDVVKSRMMGDSQGLYKGVLDCFTKTLQRDGILAFYNGFIPNVGRLAAYNMVVFTAVEAFKKRAAEALGV